MANLIYSAITSLDGYINDVNGKFDWAEPDEQVHAFINDLERDAGTHLYGRRMYEMMVVWETEPGLAAHSPLYRDFAEIWSAAVKVVYSNSLSEVSTARTHLERTFDPDAVTRMKASATRDILVGGPGLASHAFRAGLVDECHIFIVPHIVGGGTRALPDDTRLKLRLDAERRFSNGTVFLRYRTLPDDVPA